MRSPLAVLYLALGSLAWVTAAGTGVSVAADLDGRTIVEVEFFPPLQPPAAEHLRRLVILEPGAPLDRRAVNRTIHNLFATGRYADIQVEAAEVEGGVKLILRTEPNWFNGRVQVVGAPTPPTPNQLVNAARLQLGELHTETDIAQARQAIRKLLAENGFFSAAIRAVPHRDAETQQVDTTFEVSVGERAGFGRLIVTGDGGAAPQQLRRVAGWREGKAFNQRRLRRGLDRIREYFRRRDYRGVDARLGGLLDFDADANRVNLVLHIDRGPKMSVRLEGGSISPSRLRKYLPIFEEGVIDEDLLNEGARNLRDYFQTRGYFSARVEPSVERENAEELIIVYRIDRGPLHKLVRLDIRGYEFFDYETIRERMLIQQKTLQMRRGRFSQTLLDGDVRAIEELYRGNGFRDVELTARVEDDYRGKKGDLAVFIEISEGSYTTVRDLRIRGIKRFSEDEFRPQLASAPGQVYSEVSIAADRDLILGRYFDAGFQDARFSWREIEADGPNEVILEYEIDEGEAVHVRRPIVAGLRHTHRSLVEQQLQIQPDAPLSQTAMLETQRRLYDLGIFSKVDVGLQNPQGDEPTKNVLLQLEEARRWTVRFGGGAEFARIGGNTADLTAPVGDASFSPRVTVEVSRLNVRGIGHTMSLRTRFSNLQQRVLLTYEAPRWTGSDRWHMILSALLDTSRNVRTFTGTRAEGALQLRQQLSKPSSVLYRYTYRRTTISGDTLQISPFLIPLVAQPVRVGLLSGTYIQDRRDDPTDATKGLFNTFDLSLASGAWGSEPDFVRVLGQNSTYHRLTRRVVLARTLRVGMMFSTGRFGDPAIRQDPAAFGSNPDSRIPLSERFFAGGANAHRGFPVNQAGPRDPITGFPVGGGALFVNGVELRFPLVGENIGGVLFHDAGNIYSKPGRVSFRTKQPSRRLPDSLPGYEFDYMVHAVGLGVRYRTPIGPLRLDMAYSVNPPRFIGFEGTREQLLNNTGRITQQRISHFQFHFSLGQTF